MTVIPIREVSRDKAERAALIQAIRARGISEARETVRRVLDQLCESKHPIVNLKARELRAEIEG